MQKHAFPSSNTAAFIVTVFTNHSVLLQILQAFHPYMSLKVHISMIKHSARTSLTDALIVKTTPDL